MWSVEHSWEVCLMQSSKRASAALPGWLTALVSVPLVLAACSSPAATQPAGGGAPTSAAAKPAATTAPAAASSGDKIELRFAWWGSQDRHDRTIKVIQLFEQQHPNINITYEFA